MVLPVCYNEISMKALLAPPEIACRLLLVIWHQI